MEQNVELELPSDGGSVFAVAEGDVGFRELATVDGVKRKLTDFADDIRQALSVFASSLADLGQDEAELEINFAVGSGGAVKILGADVKGGIKVTLKWHKSK